MPEKDLQSPQKDLVDVIQETFSKLSKGQKIIAQYILSDYDKAAFMTAARLGEVAGVSESTVVRFSNAIGFTGYPMLQKALQELIKTKLTTVQRVEMSTEYSDDVAILNKVLRSDMENIRSTLDDINAKSFQRVINKMLTARRIYVVGLRSSGSIAEYMGFYLNLILENVTVVHNQISDVLEQMLNLGPEDLVFVVSFPRYARRTFELMDFAKNQGAFIAALTDSYLAPIAQLADEVLIAESNMASFVDSLVAPLSVVNAIIVSAGMRKKEEIKENFDKLEELWRRYGIYDEK